MCSTHCVNSRRCQIVRGHVVATHHHTCLGAFSSSASHSGVALAPPRSVSCGSALGVPHAAPASSATGRTPTTREHICVWSRSHSCLHGLSVPQFRKLPRSLNDTCSATHAVPVLLARCARDHRLQVRLPLRAVELHLQHHPAVSQSMQVTRSWGVLAYHNGGTLDTIAGSLGGRLRQRRASRLIPRKLVLITF